MIRYRLFQHTPEGFWQSEVTFEARDLLDVRQNVIAGFLNGQPRWAEEEGTGRRLFGLDAKGKVTG